jgi:hypothetical protein
MWTFAGNSQFESAAAGISTTDQINWKKFAKITMVFVCSLCASSEDLLSYHTGPGHRHLVNCSYNGASAYQLGPLNRTGNIGSVTLINDGRNL